MAPIALLSVSNKHGIVSLAESLHRMHGFQLLSSGGTAKVLEDAGLPVTRVAEHTGAAEILGGRVKTLHPRVHGGILAMRGDPDHEVDLEQHQIPPIDVVVVNLYPFRETVANPQVSWETAIENIDIGGPAMVRAAAKNHAHVAVLTRPDQYDRFLVALSDGVDGPLRRELALEAFEHTAAYDVAISHWMGERLTEQASQWLEAIPLRQRLRYGENPHQHAAWYSAPKQGWGGAIQLQGKELSTNNLLDLEAALATVREFGYGTEGAQQAVQDAAVVVKHTNPCGVAIGTGVASALSRALDADRVSAFGGIVALNGLVDATTARELTSCSWSVLWHQALNQKLGKSLPARPTYVCWNWHQVPLMRLVVITFAPSSAGCWCRTKTINRLIPPVGLWLASARLMLKKTMISPLRGAW